MKGCLRVFAILAWIAGFFDLLFALVAYTRSDGRLVPVFWPCSAAICFFLAIVSGWISPRD